MLSSKILRHILAPLVLLALAALIIAQSSRGAGLQRWQALLDQQTESAGRIRFAARVGGSEPYERDADNVFVPGGLTQLFLAGAALERLGPDHRFETRIEWRLPNPLAPHKIADLTIHGSGDPSWGMPEWNESELSRFEQIAQILKDQGVHEIHGPIRFVAGDPRFEKTSPPVGWLEEDLTTCEGAVPRAFNVKLNCATLQIVDPAESHWEETGLDIPVRLDLDWGDRTVLKVERDGDGYRIRGTWADSPESSRLKLPVPESARWEERLMEIALLARQIALKPRSRLPEAPGRFVTQPVAVAIHSPPLRELLKPLLKDGAGLIAESLFIALGGQSALRDYLDRNFPNERTVSLWDGSGLSRSNTASAREILALLELLKQGPHFDQIWDALSVAGVDGKLSRRMRGDVAEGLVRAKTSSMPGNAPIAGFAPRYNGGGRVIELVPFVFLAEGRKASRKTVLKAQDRIAAELVRALNF